MRITVIHNPGAGDGAMAADRLLALLGGAGHTTVYQSTREAGFPGILDQAADLVVVAGGDGTIGRLARALGDRRPPLAVLPLGTANNIAKALGHGQPLLSLVPLLATGRLDNAQVFDLGLAKGPWGRRLFLEGIGLGALTEAAAAMDGADVSGLTAAQRVALARVRVLESLARIDPLEVSVTLDGQDLSGRYLLLEAVNTALIGPNLPLAPGADHGDGLLDLVCVGEADRGAALAWIEGGAGSGAPPPMVRRGRHLILAWEGARLRLDDAYWPEDAAAPVPPTRVEITMDATALTFLGHLSG